MFNAQKKTAFVKRCLLSFRSDSSHLCSDGLARPLQILLDSSCPVPLFFQHCPAAPSELSSLGHGRTTLHPDLKHNTWVPVWSALGRGILRRCWWNAGNCLKRKDVDAAETNSFEAIFWPTQLQVSVGCGWSKLSLCIFNYLLEIVLHMMSVEGN